eukprot:6283156-Lingulodinium_polyedra.AAC.1
MAGLNQHLVREVKPVAGHSPIGPAAHALPERTQDCAELAKQERLAAQRLLGRGPADPRNRLRERLRV